MAHAVIDRAAHIAGMQEMLGWLAGRPELPLPLHGSRAITSAGGCWGDAGEAFRVFAPSVAELDRLVAQFDAVEFAPIYPNHPVGARRLFGPVAYELLLDEDPVSDLFGERQVGKRPEPVRTARIAGLRELVNWLEERPTLGPRLLQLPRVFAGEADDGSDDEVLFAKCTESAEEQDALLKLFDQVERRAPDQPAYLKPAVRWFSGGVGFEVRVA